MAASFMARADGFGGDKFALELCGVCARICEEWGMNAPAIKPTIAKGVQKPVRSVRRNAEK